MLSTSRNYIEGKHEDGNLGSSQYIALTHLICQQSRWLISEQGYRGSCVRVPHYRPYNTAVLEVRVGVFLTSFFLYFFLILLPIYLHISFHTHVGRFRIIHLSSGQTGGGVSRCIGVLLSSCHGDIFGRASKGYHHTIIIAQILLLSHQSHLFFLSSPQQIFFLKAEGRGTKRKKRKKKLTEGETNKKKKKKKKKKKDKPQVLSRKYKIHCFAYLFGVPSNIKCIVQIIDIPFS